MRAPLVLVIIIALFAPAHAEEGGSGKTLPCLDIDKAKTLLADKMDEHPTAAGMADDTAIILFTATDGTFALLAVGDDGKACIAALGHAWHAITPKKGEKNDAP